MPWITKAKLRIQLAVEQTKNEASQHEIERLKEYIVKCENLIDHERGRVTAEQERADRINDSLLRQNGLPESSSTGRAEVAAQQSEWEEKFKEQQKVVAEIFGESMDDYGADGVQSMLEEKVN